MGVDINNFLFCQAHGSEVCHICGCDYREGNVTQIEIADKLDDLPDTFNLYERMPINAFQKGAIYHAGGKYKCTMHGVINCQNCFNWIELIRAEAEDAVRTQHWLEKRKKWLDKVDP
ncbi:uncharacterized protein FOMMEDRAFT_133140 [Fomitiporia mediterranea MF3/22]|uniref:uncharacterized protein n=1 Tax=Fomitiporia mediterranea (strain MF3/22) TaxID=694068 RepID=UPI0004408E68|nr:uncharacterized protein FOMMEDRAFT_133140 [Fomitiporia mediterranea MF3/22]EJD03755.1 hypothetical protein FOMMEDRAFT_133140 [Fomitiporia mediterranea MF3/22]